MKKFIVPIIAVVFAISLSAFTVNQKEQKSLTLRYWFEYDAITGVGDPLGGGQLMDYETAESFSCVHVEGTDCARGYDDDEDPEGSGNPPQEFIEKAE